MKKITLLFSLLFVMLNVQGQELWKGKAVQIDRGSINKVPVAPELSEMQAVWEEKARLNVSSSQNIEKTVIDCAIDTSLYTLIKRRNFDFVRLAAPSGFLPSALQRYQIPTGTSVTIHGFDFNGFMIFDSAANLSSLPVNYAMYGDDGMGRPDIDNPLVTGTSTVDTSGTNRSDGSIFLFETNYSIAFNMPITVSGNFYLEIENPSTTNFVILWSSAPGTNGVGSGDGRGEDDGWYSLNQNGQQFFLPGTSLFSVATGTTDTTFLDQDNFLHPHISYSIEAGFDLQSGDCLPHGEISIFENTTSEIAGNKYFNRWTAESEYQGGSDTTFQWLPDVNTSQTLTVAKDLITTYQAPLTSATVALFVNDLGYSRVCFDSLTRTFDAGGLAVADFSFTVDTNQTVTFTNDSDPGDYLWDFGDGNTSTDVIPTHTYVDGGTYNVTLTVSGDGLCPGITTKEVNVAATSIQDDLLNTQVNVFPNPSNGVFLLDINLDSPEEVRIEVRNMIGQTVFESPAQRMQVGELQLNLESQQSGIYLMTLWANDRQITRKLSLNK